MPDLQERVTALVKSGELTFEGARKRHNLAPGAFGVLARTATEWAAETGNHRAPAITQACAAYWAEYDKAEDNGGWKKPKTLDKPESKKRKRKT